MNLRSVILIYHRAIMKIRWIIIKLEMMMMMVFIYIKFNERNIKL